MDPGSSPAASTLAVVCTIPPVKMYSSYVAAAMPDGGPRQVGGPPDVRDRRPRSRVPRVSVGEGIWAGRGGPVLRQPCIHRQDDPHRSQKQGRQGEYTDFFSTFNVV